MAESLGCSLNAPYQPILQGGDLGVRRDLLEEAVLQAVMGHRMLGEDSLEVYLQGNDCSLAHTGNMHLLSTYYLQCQTHHKVLMSLMILKHSNLHLG